MDQFPQRGGGHRPAKQLLVAPPPSSASSDSSPGKAAPVGRAGAGTKAAEAAARPRCGRVLCMAPVCLS
ncbi:hypothetical protein VTG60DRAFT_1133 [Thermothelomyces hinnuleus]